MKCPAWECPFRNEMGYCKVTACIRWDLIEEYNDYTCSNKTERDEFPLATNGTSTITVERNKK